jgi:hypothetical protein
MVLVEILFRHLGPSKRIETVRRYLAYCPGKICAGMPNANSRPVEGIRDRWLQSNQIANFPKNEYWRCRTIEHSIAYETMPFQQDAPEVENNISDSLHATSFLR